MRVFAAVLAGMLLTTVSVAEAKKQRRQTSQKASQKSSQKQAAAKRTKERERPKQAKRRQEERRIAIRERAREIDEDEDEGDEVAAPEPERPRRRELDDDDVRPRRARMWVPQSYGAPWDGELANASRLRLLEGALIRRPARAFGTRTTVDFVRQAVNDTLEAVAPAHELAIGDLSTEHGGPISDHHSHQSGRDADIGLFYRQVPRGYPSSFARATEDNIDCPATFTLIANFIRTANQDGGVQVIFLDYQVQGMLYRWAIEHDLSESLLDRIFEYPNGKGSGGIVRHYPGHDNHMHVRFRCASSDDDCR